MKTVTKSEQDLFVAVRAQSVRILCVTSFDIRSNSSALSWHILPAAAARVRSFSRSSSLHCENSDPSAELGDQQRGLNLSALPSIWPNSHQGRSPHLL